MAEKIISYERKIYLVPNGDFLKKYHTGVFFVFETKNSDIYILWLKALNQRSSLLNITHKNNGRNANFPPSFRFNSEDKDENEYKNDGGTTRDLEIHIVWHNRISVLLPISSLA